MAIIQISKIQVRSGNLVDLPQLDEAEFGFATDVKKLYIGKESPNENVEVLTSYSTIAFSQIDGSVGNLNISALSVENGQVLTYDGNNWVNRGGNAGGLITLGDVSNVKIEGGAIGYILETDGIGNLSWTPKGVLVANMENATQANPCVITTEQENFFVDGQEVTITNVPGMTQLNGNKYYANVITSTTFSLYSDSGLTTPVNSTGFTAFASTSVTATTTGTNIITVGSSAIFTANQTVKFVGTTFGGLEEDTTYYIKTIPSGTEITVSLTVGGNAVPLSSASGSCTVYRTGGRIVAALGTGSGAVAVAGSNRAIQYNDSGVFGGDSNFTWDEAAFVMNINGNANVGNLNASNSVIANTLISVIASPAAPLSVASNVRVANLNVAHSNVSDFGNVTAQTTGTFYPVFANGNTTANYALGSNANLSFNAATGNLSTVIINATGNITGANLNTSGRLSVTGNANVGNLGTSGQVISSGNVTGSNLVTSGVVSATGNITGGNLITTGNANVGNLNITGIVTGNLIPSADVTYDLGNSTRKWNNLYLAGNTLYLGSLTIQDISGALTTTQLSITGNSNVGNLGTSGQIIATGNITAGNLVTSGSLSTTGNANVGNLGASGQIIITGNITGGNIETTGTLVAAGNANVGNLGVTGVIAATLSATGNANVGNLGTSGLIVASGNITGANIVTGGLISATGNITGGNLITVGNLDTVGTANIGNLSVLGDSNTVGTVTAGILVSENDIRAGDVAGDAFGRFRFIQSTNIYGLSYNNNGVVVITNENGTTNQALVLGDSTGSGNIFGITYLASGGSDPTTGIESGWTSKLALDANGNLVTAGKITAGGNVIGVNFIGSGIVNVLGNVQGSNIVGTGNLSITGNANVGNLGAATVVASTLTTGANTTTGSLIGTFTVDGGASGNSLIVTNGNLVTLGIRTDNYYFANGVPLSFTGAYSNSNVANYLPVYSGNISGNNISITNNANTANITASGLIIGANIFSTGNLTVTSNLSSGNINSLGTLISVGTATVNELNSNGTVTGNIILSNNDVRFGNVPADAWGRLRFANATTIYGFTFNTNAATILTNEELSQNQALVLGDTGAGGSETIFGISVRTGGTSSPTTGLEAGWTPVLRLAGTSTLFANTFNGNVSATSVSTANITTGANVNAGTLTGTWTVNGGLSGNSLIVANGNVYTSGIRTDNYYFANGTPINFAGTYSNTNVASYMPVYGGDGLFANIITTNSASVNTSATNSTVTNLNTTNITTGANTTTGILQGTWNFIGGAAGNTIVLANGNIAITGVGFGIKTDNFYYANGTPINLGGNYSNSNVASYLPTFAGTVGAGSGTTLRGTTLTTGATATAGNITGNWTLTSGSILQSTYADLAEYYNADQHYFPGTVLEFGGINELTLAKDGSRKVAGVVSTDPAYAMNAKCPGEYPTAIALQGRVPTKVRGNIKKGDMMISAGDGYARPCSNPLLGSVIGKALVDFNGVEGVIEIAIGRI